MENETNPLPQKNQGLLSLKAPRLKRLKILNRRAAGSDLEKRGMHVYILPNLFTTGNLFFGFWSMICSLQGDFVKASYMIVGAAIFDTLDGRVARLTNATSKFGVEYDSLSDLVSFGVAPALLLYLWALQPFERVGWLAAFVFMACGALRLARFNVQAASIEKKYFQGLPIPMAAGIVATSVSAFAHLGLQPQKNYFILAMTIGLGFVMVSNFRYRSFKEVDFKKRKPFLGLVVALCILVFIALNPEVNLFIAFAGYAILGAVFGILSTSKAKVTQVIVSENLRRQKKAENTNGPDQ
jgi:CDP-diacylglycerol--serine O-phosphatidyltransferase